MDIFDLLSLFGGLAMFLYGMRLMGRGLQEGSSGTLKVVMEKATRNVFVSFILGMGVTALIQSSTATIVITSGLVAANIITLKQSLGIIVGANVGTTMTGQIIRLLDLNNSTVKWLQVFKPSTLAPVALIIGIILIMTSSAKKKELIGTVAIGFGILFTGLLTMSGSVSALNETGALTGLFARLDGSPLIGYLIGAGIAFLLQSSSATIGILQAFAMTGGLTFRGIYATLVGIYLGDCVTTAIVCSIGAKPEARRVGIVNILFNLSETLLVLTVVTLLHRLGALNGIWRSTITSGDIANTNTVFNLGCAILLLPMLGVYEKLSRRIVRDKPAPVSPYSDKLAALNPNFFRTPAIAFSACFDALQTMFGIARNNIDKAYDLLTDYREEGFHEIAADEDTIDMFADRVSNYLVLLSPYIQEEGHTRILNQYYKLISEFERLGDHAVNISEVAKGMSEENLVFSPNAVRELRVCKNILNQILDYTNQAVTKHDAEAARHIEPLEEVVDDIVDLMQGNHLVRLTKGVCTFVIDSHYVGLLGDIERISDICSNIGLTTIARNDPSMEGKVHDYISRLHQGQDAEYNRMYKDAHDMYLGLIGEEN